MSRLKSPTPHSKLWYEWEHRLAKCKVKSFVSTGDNYNTVKAIFVSYDSKLKIAHTFALCTASRRVALFISIGWGRTVGGGNAADTLQQAMLPVAEHSACSSVNGKLLPVDETSMVCAGGQGKGGCQVIKISLCYFSFSKRKPSQKKISIVIGITCKWQAKFTHYIQQAKQ